MNRKLLLISLFVLLNVFAISVVSAKDIAYVVKTYETANIVSSLNELGYSYDIINDANVPSVNFSQYSVILVQDSITNKNYLPLTTKNIVFLNKDLAPFVWTSGTIVTGSSSVFSASLDQIGTPFTEGFSTITFDAYTTGKPIYYLRVYPTGITSVSRSTGSTGSYPIVAYSNSSNIRRVFFGFYSVDYWSADGKKLFKNSLKWARMGADGDGDGYYSDVDCNDNNASLWRNISGYLDSDKDGYGAGNLLQVCSGTNLLSGYSLVAGDCNNNNASLWRNISGYLDSDNDGYGAGNLLQVCSGNTLTSGYANINGDCNDSSALKWRLLNGYVDADNDGRGSGNILSVCSGETLISGYSNMGGDCNDSNANIWRLVKGYLDFDSDGYGVGELLDVCSGFDLSSGYSTTKGDCNDSNMLVNPSALEIPYNNVDEMCLGFDLADVDDDGYCKLGYLIENSSLQCNKEIGILGTDCNDNNASVNLDSNDLSANCKNDNFILNDIASVSVRETEKASITINAIDPENDELIYSINDSRFIQNESNAKIFYWTTGYGDEGSYSFEASVSDGEFEQTKVFRVDVSRTNRIPVCENVDDIAFNEDGSFEIDMNDYCSDLDEDGLNFEIISKTDKINANVVGSMINVSGIADFNGEGSFIVKVSDGFDNIFSNIINIIVNEVNDAPVFEGNIDNVNTNEEQNITNSINLKNYFNDWDSNLSFDVTGNYFVDIVINDSLVSFYPKPGFYGTEVVVFSGNDSEFTAYSNPVSINVEDINQAPVFGELDCQLNINEDTEYTCELNASDVENDSFSFRVLSNTRMNCTIVGNTLKYLSDKDQVGKGICNIVVEDLRGARREKQIEVSMINVNDAPLIKDYYPRENSVKILENVQTRFLVVGYDIDGEFNVTWKLNDVVVGNSSSYYLNQTKGNYNLSAIVSDGTEQTIRTWNINVGNINDFTCSEMKGYVCNENQTCNGNLIGVHDTTSCCSIQCSTKPPQFNNIKNISANKTNSVELTLDSGDEIYLGDSHDYDVEIENNYEDMDFDVEFYIYDLTKQKIIDKDSKDISIDEGDTKNVSVNFTLEGDLDEENKYYLFVRTIGKNSNGKVYSEKYELLDVNRKDSDLLIKDLVLNENSATCSDEVVAKVSLENLGKIYQYVSIRLKNDDLGLSSVSDGVRVGAYEDDAVEKEITFTIPEDAKEGKYLIRAEFGNYNSNQFIEKELIIEDCNKNQEITTISVETIRINPSSNNEIAVPSVNEDNKLIIWIVGIFSVVTMGILLAALAVYMNKINLVDNGHISKMEEFSPTIEVKNDKIIVNKRKKSRK